MSRPKKKNLQFQLPVQRVYQILCENFPKNGVSSSSTVFMTAVLEYLTAEILELASKKATERKSEYISRQDIAFVMQADQDLKSAFPGVGAVQQPSETSSREPSLIPPTKKK